MSIKFTYTKLGVTEIFDGVGVRHQIPGKYVWGVTTGEGERHRVLGLAQESPSFRGKWFAVAALDPQHYPAVDYDRGLWSLPSGYGDFGSKREAAVWLLGVSDARSDWFAATVRENTEES